MNYSEAANSARQMVKWFHAFTHLEAVLAAAAGAEAACVAAERTLRDTQSNCDQVRSNARNAMQLADKEAEKRKNERLQQISDLEKRKDELADQLRAAAFAAEAEANTQCALAAQAVETFEENERLRKDELARLDALIAESERKLEDIRTTLSIK